MSNVACNASPLLAAFSDIVYTDGVRAAFYQLRCFPGEEAEYPVMAVAFVIYGCDEEEIAATAGRYYAWYEGECEPKCVRAERVGPYFLKPGATCWSGERTVKWERVAVEVANQEAGRNRQDTSCKFISPGSLTVDGEPVEGEEAEALWQEGKEEFAMALRGEAKKDGRRFYFLGLRLTHEMHRPVGEVHLIEVAGLDEASAICTRIVAGGADIWTEWCPRVFPADGLGAEA